jgi:starch synthase
VGDETVRLGLVAQGDVAYALDLADLLCGHGVDVSLYLSRALAEREVGTTKAVAERLHESGILPRACRVHLVTLPRMRDPRSFNVMRSLGRAIQRDGVDVAHILAGPGEIWLAILASILRSIPVVSTMIVPKQNVGQAVPASIVWASNKLLALGSDVIVVNGNDQVEQVHKLYGISPRRIAYMPLGARTTALKWATAARQEEPGTVLFFGRADPHKGLEYLIRAQPLISRHVPNARILVCGHGDELTRCRRMVKDESKFEFVEGFVTGYQQSIMFRRSSLVALPYVSASTSGVLVTAYTFGRPVVATAVGSLPSYVVDGVTGILVEPKNETALAEAIAGLLIDDEFRHRLGRAAEGWIRAREDGVLNRALNVYRRIIQARGGIEDFSPSGVYRDDRVK